MQIKLEELKYQEVAIQSVVKVFDGNIKNTFDNSCFEGIRSNNCTLSDEQISENIQDVLAENGIEEKTAKVSKDKELTIEMETGTGKTLVYVKTICELYKHYGFTKFIILVPSVAIRQGVLKTLNTFEKQLEDIYGFVPKSFEYNSKKLSKVTNFIEEQHPQIMIMTLASFNSEDKILNQAKREDLFANVPFIEAIGRTNPIVVMDEPQEGMDTANSVKQITKLNPLFKLRYSATHKVVKNLIYRLTPYDSYKQGLVKKIEVLTVTEKNDEATLKLELTEIQNGKNPIRAKIKAWHQSASGKIEFKETKWLKDGDNLGTITNNPSYLKYRIERINKSLRTQKWSVTFTNGTQIFEKQTSGNIESIWALQLEWLIIRHFTKKQKLQARGIKCLSLVFIDKVANYVSEEPIIKKLFMEKYKALYPEFHDGKIPTNEHIEAIQGFYFAKTGKGEFTDNETSMRKNSDVFDAILKDKEELLSYGDSVANKIEFIFSHSALGVGWDNPNIFNIATLNNSYSEIKKRQEIGRGLRIAVNQDGQRVYDALDVAEDKRINQLTVIPNETYETFVTQYQEEINEIYGTTSAGAGMTHTHKGKPQNEVHFKRNQNETINQAFRRFWEALAKKTNFSVAFDEQALIARSIEALNAISIADYQAEVSSRTIGDISESGIQDEFAGKETYKLKAYYTPLDLLEELSENTGLSYNSLFKIVKQLNNHEDFAKNPPQYIHQSANLIKNIELEEMLRGLDYHLTNETFPFEFDDFVKNIQDSGYGSGYVDTPRKGVFDKMLIDSEVERKFAIGADRDDELVCFLKLPSYYKIPTPIGEYEPDFGIVMKRKQLRDGKESEFYFVIETKGTNDINDKKALKESEVYKILCAVKHFNALGVDVKYKAPVKDYMYFKDEAVKDINAITEK
ncbi:type III restriction enzyme, res subunit [Sphingobacterium spiritivorum ATCC 33300]|uniref:Type III restriction enzyme, res subunit n=1 Tax=Sphingobacterium spiritivorum ATCC 33300 TaxID=525372 RepID=C2FUQ1_SPHSI|nr:DEAD/DEAH box helicase family protein [Sphingobacterium spiritivorum]EEI93384.1 type III restriction enzyme, res subunit [Sphingobacterium spiritivorum ATCC 33300]QQS95958.1 DEAD/DEAH box helicase family protein [Sphingobacterium spiritivorum]